MSPFAVLCGRRGPTVTAMRRASEHAGTVAWCHRRRGLSLSDASRRGFGRARAATRGRGLPATLAGYRALHSWLEGFGPIAALGIESTSSYGAGLTRWLTGRQVCLLEVNQPHKHARSRKGKSRPRRRPGRGAECPGRRDRRRAERHNRGDRVDPPDSRLSRGGREGACRCNVPAGRPDRDRSCRAARVAARQDSPRAGRHVCAHECGRIHGGLPSPCRRPSSPCEASPCASPPSRGRSADSTGPSRSSSAEPRPSPLPRGQRDVPGSIAATIVRRIGHCA